MKTGGVSTDCFPIEIHRNKNPPALWLWNNHSGDYLKLKLRRLISQAISYAGVPNAASLN